MDQLKGLIYNREPIARTPILKCGDDEVQTNSDRIRSMSDEELAKWLEYEGGGACAEVCGWLEWLRKPAEED